MDASETNCGIFKSVANAPYIAGYKALMTLYAAAVNDKFWPETRNKYFISARLGIESSGDREIQKELFKRAIESGAKALKLGDASTKQNKQMYGGGRY